MNDDELNNFLAKVMCFQDGCLSEIEIKDLEDEMLASPEKREAFANAMVLSQSLNDHMPLEQQGQNHTKSIKFPTFLRSCAILTLGVILGVSSMSVANALSRDFSLFAPFLSFFDSFEKEPQPEQKGIPLKAEVWGGDSTVYAAKEEGITPYAGKSMLKMLKADFPGKPVPGGYVSEVYRWVDLSSVKQHLENDKAEVTLSTVMNAVKTKADDKYFFGIAVYAYDSIPDFLVPNLDAFSLRDKSIASANRQQILFDDDLKSWQRVNLDMTIPSSARFLLIRLAVSRDQLSKNEPGFIYPGHYIDDFKVMLKPRLFEDSH
jgi:hypothetical protein